MVASHFRSTDRTKRISGVITLLTTVALTAISTKASFATEYGQASSDASNSATAPVAAPVPTKRLKVALALGGGGTRGAAHIGVLKVLEREHIQIDYIAGTSMGAIVGGLYAAGIPLQQIEDEFVGSNKLLLAYFSVSIPVRIAAIPVFYIPHLFGYHPYDGLYNGKKFSNYLESLVPSDRKNIEDLKIPFVAVSSNLVDATPYSITKGTLGKALQASSAIPFLRRPVFYNSDVVLIDGFLEGNIPVSQARDMGADIVIAVNVDERVHRHDPSNTFRHILAVPNRVASMFLAKVDDDAVKGADIVIHPEVDGIHLLSERRPDARRAIDAGEKAATEALATIRARLSQSQIAGDETRR